LVSSVALSLQAVEGGPWVVLMINMGVSFLLIEAVKLLIATPFSPRAPLYTSHLSALPTFGTTHSINNIFIFYVQGLT
jgi:uncharacterized membrane protein